MRAAILLAVCVPLFLQGVMVSAQPQEIDLRKVWELKSSLLKEWKFKEIGDTLLDLARVCYERQEYEKALILYYHAMCYYQKGGFVRDSLSVMDEVFSRPWPAEEVTSGDVPYFLYGFVKVRMVTALMSGDLVEAKELANVLEETLETGRFSYGSVNLSLDLKESDQRVLLLYLGKYYWWVGDEAKACEYWSRAAEIYEKGARRAWRNTWKAAYAVALYEYCGSEKAKALAEDFTSKFHKRIWRITCGNPSEHYDEITMYVRFQLYLGNTSEAMRAGELLIKTLTEEGYYYEAFEILTLLGVFNETLMEIGEKAIRDLEADLERPEKKYAYGSITWPYLRLAIAGMHLRKPEFRKYAEEAYKVRMAASNEKVFYSIVLLYWLSAGNVSRALEVWDKAGKLLSAWWLAGNWVSPPLNTSWVKVFLEEMASANKTIARGEEAASMLSGEAKVRATDLLEEAKKLYREYRFKEAEAKAKEAIKLAEGGGRRATWLLALAAVMAAVAVVAVVWFRKAKASTEGGVLSG